MHLVSIPQDGNVSVSGVALPEVANSVIGGTIQVYCQRGFVEPWIGYLAVEGEECVGSCGFTSPPVEKVAEIAYFTFPGFEKRGIATFMVQRLVAIAGECDPSVTIIAHTLPGENASNRILKKLGFRFARTIDHPEDGTIWQWSYESKLRQA